jgi:uncharacterized protein (DUF2384 family)
MTTVQNSMTREIQRATEQGVTVAQLADATGVTLSTARRWKQGTSAPVGEHAARMLELTSIVERLQQVINPDYVPIWLSKPIPRLDDRRPVDAIAAGGYRQVSKLVGSLEEMPVS